MSNSWNEKLMPDISADNPVKESPRVDDDWSDVTKDLLNSLPQVWSRGILYFLFCFISITLPWAMFFQVDETGAARGKLEPKGKTVKLDSAVAGTVANILIKEGETVKAGEPVLILESELVQAELRQGKDRLEGQLNRLSQLKIVKNQLAVALATQKQQTQAQELEKQAQIEQAQQNFIALKNSYIVQNEEKLTQVNQAKEAIEETQTASKLMESSLASAKREVERYRQLKEAGAVPEINVVDKQDIAKERQRLYEKSQSDIKQASLRLAEKQSNYQRTIRQVQAEIEQAYLRLQEQQISHKTLIHSGKLAVLKSEEQIKNLDTEVMGLNAEITQSRNQIKSLQLQLQQRKIKSPITGKVFQLPIQRPGSVVQAGTMVAEIAPAGSPLIMRATMATTESGSLKKGLPVKLKFDAYPFQDYGVIEGELLEISPTTIDVETPNGKVSAYNLEILLTKDCIPSNNQCIPLRPGDTATAEVIVRQRKIIDFLLDPFKQLDKGGLKL
ncbi:HlyD family secretion protein [Calothrix sp. NIES-4101]|nr:HlyD family secretion protein [Calothrix sp. NIES-4101]